MTIGSTLRFLSFAGVCLAMTSSAFAANRLSPACRTELQALCPRSSDHSARHACFRERKSEVSQVCKDQMRARRAARWEARANRRLSADAPPRAAADAAAMPPAQ